MCKEKEIKIKKLELKLKMMEISFEQINNSRNDMIKQLAAIEISTEKIINELHATQKMYTDMVKTKLNLEWKVELLRQKLNITFDDESLV